jgi:hypothetical protein
MNIRARTLAAVVTTTLLAAAFSACSGRSGSSCRKDGDCASGLYCAGPNGPPVCGMGPRRGCMQTSDCPAMEQCHAIDDACSASGIGSACGPPCGACGVGLRCNAQGACEPSPCDQGFACAPYQRCDPTTAGDGPVYAHTHGCVSVPCTGDADCPASTVCVNGVCQTGPGTCETVVAVP